VDGMALSRAVFGALLPVSGGMTVTAAERIKSVLLEEARRDPLPNTVATSILKIDKEVGLVRYWGLAEYLKQNPPFATFSFAALLSSNPSSAETVTGSNPEHDSSVSPNAPGSATGSGGDGVGVGGSASSKPTTSANTARIAFMITSSMKRDLVDGLGYPASAIKGMTPQQASLVVHHRLPPESYDEQIPELEKSFAEEQQQQEQEQARIIESAASVEEDKPSSEPSASTTTMDSSIADSGSDSDASVRSSSPAEGSSSDGSSDSELQRMPASSSVDDSHESSSAPFASSSTENAPPTSAPSMYGNGLWYEVVEIQTEPASEIRHGLYKDREEALLGLDTRQRIQAKREKEDTAHGAVATGTTRFVLRPISEKDLQ